MIEIEQTVEFRGAVEGSVISFEQFVKGNAEAQTVVAFEQNVRNLADVGKCFISDWDLVLTINGAVGACSCLLSWNGGTHVGSERGRFGEMRCHWFSGQPRAAS